MENDIHKSSIIGPDVSFGKGNIVGPGAIVIGPCEIGNDNWIGPHVVIGTPGQFHHAKHDVSWEKGSFGHINIGSGNVFREFSTIHVSPGTQTIVGNSCYVMTHAHIPHDALIEDEVKIANSVNLGGYVHVARGAYIGLGANVHQRLYIGPGAMVGMGSVVTTNVPPLAKFFGSPARLMGFNDMKVNQFDLTDQDKLLLITAFNARHLPDPESLSEAGKILFRDYYNTLS